MAVPNLPGRAATAPLPRLRVVARDSDTRVAMAYLALGLVLVAVGMVDIWRFPPDAGPGRWWFAAPLVAACALVVVRRRRPVPALVAGLAVGAGDALLGGSTGVVLVVLDLLHAAARHAHPATARWVHRGAVAAVVAGTGAASVATGDARLGANVALLLFALVATPVWWGWSLRQQDELSGLRAQVAVRDERARMARDLHDALAGNLSAAALRSAAALVRPADEADPDRRALRAVRDSTVAALDDVRDMIAVLREDQAALASPPRLAEAPRLLGTARAAGLAVTARLPPALGLPAAVDQTAYRVVQEALTNAAKHGPGGSARVTVDARDGTLEIQVTSRAPGAEPAAPAAPAAPARNGFGLIAMRDRVRRLGGEVEAGPDGPDAWQVRATLPLRPGRGRAEEVPA
ncbi:MAG: sensor histidine kinase [Kineosporiaceae bacterium]